MGKREDVYLAGPARLPVLAPGEIPRFACDAGLGGLARWLRAAGYEADWHPDIDDTLLVSIVRRTGEILITTDTLLMRRRLIRDGSVRALWIPPRGTKQEQLERVLTALGIPARESRCMRCGGELDEVDKTAIREKIPPKTYGWLDEYWQCKRCDQVFWRGTHWDEIRETLEKLRAAD